MLHTLTAYSRTISNLNFDAEAEDFVDSETETTLPVVREDDRGVTEWLDAFVAHECDRAVLLRGVADSVAENPEDGWELLALVDQYYRRNKLSAEDFQALHAQVRTLLLGTPAAAKVAPPPAPLEALAPEPHPNTPLLAMAASAVAPPTDVNDAPSPPRTVVVGEQLRSRYRIQGILGRGGMGTVYAAVDQYRLNDAEGGQRVALKVLNAETLQRPQMLAELRGEFQRLQSLSHPNIVRVHDFDRDGELTFFTMEYLSGAPLSRVLGMRNSVALDRSHALSIIRQVGAAVAYAHSRGVVHGDLNPRNIFITDEGEVRVLDFGASHRLRPDPVICDLDDSSRIAVATPSYASCELLTGRPADARDDVYSLACISYVLLRGKHPYHGRNALVARTKRLTPRRPAGLGARQWRALKAGLQVDSKRRPDNMRKWLDDLHLAPKPMTLPPLPAVLGAQPPREGNAPWITGGLIALAAGVFWWAQANSDLIERASSNLSTTATELRNQVRVETSVTAAPTPAQTDQPRQPQAAPQAAPQAVPTAALSSVPVTGVSHITNARAVPAAASPNPQAAPPQLARIELAADTLEVSPLQPVASVVVHRRRNYHNGVSFSWWTESGTAKPGQDFVPVKARMDYIAAGENETHLLVPIVADPRRQLSKSFYVVVGDPSDDAKLGSRTITMVTIPAAN